MTSTADANLKYQDYTAPAIPMSPEHKFLFDLNGWVCIPGVLTEAEVAPIREHVKRLATDRESIAPTERYAHAGPGQVLLDHPAVVGVLNEILEPSRPDAYGFRCEGAFSIVRPFGVEDKQLPHHGPKNGPFLYRYERDRIYAGLTRVVWELNEVRAGDHATGFLSGSHKMNLPMPDAIRSKDSGWMSTYSCPPGSMIIFSECTVHAGMVWQNKDWPRIAILMAYNSYLAQWHKANMPLDVINTMPPKRRTLFRGVWGHDFHVGKPNNYFDESNVQL